MTRTLGIIMLLTMAPFALHSQETQGPDSATVKATVRRSLMDMVVAQEAFYSDHGTYAKSASEIVDGGFIDLVADGPLDEGVTVVIILSSELGWTGVSVDERVPGFVCGVFVGVDNKSPLQDDALEGEVTCVKPRG